MDIDSFKPQIDQVIHLFQADIGKIRTGRATPSLVEDVVIPAYGGRQQLKVKELATITTDGPQSLVIAPFDRSIAGDIKKGLEQANLGFSPIIDGELIRINLSPLTTERREEYIKLLHTKLENTKVMIRQIRQQMMKQKDMEFDSKTLSEDDKFRLQDQAQKLIDKFIEEVDDLGRAKEAQLRRV